MTEEKTTTMENPERIPRPEEVLDHQEELPPEQRVQPVRCQAGRMANRNCPRDATIRLDDGNHGTPVCDEHAQAWETALEAMDLSTVEDIIGDWLRIAKVWGFGDLEQLAFNAHESAKQELLKAEARADLAREIADAPSKTRKERVAELTSEQDEKLLGLIARSDALVTAYTVLEDATEDLIRDDARRRTLGILVEEKDRATEEAHAFMEEVGIRPA